jgi:ABC-2 type transport system permease protein
VTRHPDDQEHHAMTSTVRTAHASPVPAIEHRPATRARGDDGRAVLAALHSEWIKATTVRANRAVLLLTAVGGLAVSWAVATLVTDEVLVISEVGFYWTSVSSMLAAISGVLLFGSDVQHGTLATAVAARPTRWVLAVAKTGTAAVLGLVLGAVGLAVGFGGAALAGLDAGDTSSLPASIGWALAFTMLAAVLGLGIGMVVRHSTAAIGGVLVWGFVVENLLTVFLAEQVTRFLPFYAGNHLLAYDSDLDSATALAVALTRPENALVFGGYAAVTLGIGTLLLYRRDAD